MQKFLILILIFQSIYLSTAEEIIDNQQQSYSELYPDLAQGFELTRADFEDYMQEQVVFTVDPNDETLVDSTGRRSGSALLGLHNALFKSEKVIIEDSQKLFRSVILQAIESSVEIDLSNLNEEQVLLWQIQDPKTCPDGQKIAVFMYALYHKDSFFYNTLEKYVNDKNFLILLHSAASKNKSMTVQFLLNIGADKNKKSLMNETALHSATMHDSDKAAQVLVNADIDMHTENCNGHTSFDCAVWYNADKVLQILIGKGADVDKINSHGEAPLHRAALNNADKSAKRLVCADAEVDKVDFHGETPLHKAAWHNADKVAQVLIDAGADRHKKNDFGQTPLDLASYKEANKVIAILRNAEIQQSKTSS